MAAPGTLTGFFEDVVSVPVTVAIWLSGSEGQSSYAAEAKGAIIAVTPEMVKINQSLGMRCI
jgi:hypothetical protein